MSNDPDTPDFGRLTEFYTFAPERLAEALPGFEIRREVGKGSMGIVYEAIRREEPNVGQRVALKVLPPSLTLTERALARFIREGEIMSKIRHPGIVEVYDHGHRDRLHYFVMEFVDGLNLETRLRTGPLPGRDAATVGAQVARALQFAHDRGIVHRDIKPSNLILRDDGTVKITDFGLARETGTGSMTESGAIVGTPMFMAPEQITGDRADVTSRIDVYGLGATLYTLVTGQPPFDGTNAQQVLRRVLDEEPTRPSRLSSDVPPDLEALLLTAIDKDPTRRYATVAALGDDLDRFLAGEHVGARLPGPATQALRLLRKHRLATTLALAVVVLALSALWLQRVRRRGELDAQLLRASGSVARAVSGLDDQLRPLDDAERRALLNYAVAAASSVLEADRQLARAWFVRAQAYHHLEKYREACRDLDTAETIYTRPTANILHYRIDALRQLHDAASQERLSEDLRTLIRLDPSPYNRFIVGSHLKERARAVPAAHRVEVLEFALEVIEGAHTPEAQVLRAEILQRLGRDLEARALLERATTEFPDDPEVFAALTATFAPREADPTVPLCLSCARG